MNQRSLNERNVSSLPRRERERRQRRAEILRAAESVFAAQGFHLASIEKIASAAEYASGTVYLYFRDKETLYLELFEGKIRELSELIRRRTRGLKDPLEALRRLVAARMEYFEQNRAFFRIYAREGMNRYEAPNNRWSRIMRLYTSYLDRLARLITQGQRRGVFRRGGAHQLAVALSGMMIELTREKLQKRVAEPLTELSPFVLEVFLNGASTRRTQGPLK
ncbi:MAG TPA: TetR/AcrR family transcriptional regulator [Patescibacteria group bacterium]|nr:TetR/AcrR family transcriptional regulator [Patescibacteria group bacterium]